MSHLYKRKLEVCSAITYANPIGRVAADFYAVFASGLSIIAVFMPLVVDISRF
ncbi:hypothetical protein D3C86_1918690 [compost metagenome]